MIRLIQGYMPGYGSHDVYTIRVVCENRLLEEWQGGTLEQRVRAAIALETKWTARANRKGFKRLLVRKKLASPWCGECGGDTLGGTSYCVDRVFCHRPECQKMIEVRKAEYAERNRRMEEERLAQEEARKQAKIKELDDRCRDAFHWRDGWYFKRNSECIEVFHREPGSRWASPDLSIPHREWKSIVDFIEAAGGAQ